MLIKQILLTIFGFSSGFAIAGGVFALIVTIGLISRFVAFTGTGKHILLYEDSILMGGIFGNLVFLFRLRVPIGIPGVFLFALFSGIFVGCMAIAIAEALKVIPIMLRRANIRHGLGCILLSMALGKLIGSLLQYYFGWMK